MVYIYFELYRNRPLCKNRPPFPLVLNSTKRILLLPEELVYTTEKKNTLFVTSTTWFVPLQKRVHLQQACSYKGGDVAHTAVFL